jgi:hypothetical protein
LALEIIEELEEVLAYDWVGGDTIYGNSPELRKALQRRGAAYVLDVGEELKVCLAEPLPYVPVVVGKGGKRTRLVVAEKTVGLKDLSKQIKAEGVENDNLSGRDKRQIGQRSSFEASLGLEKRNGGNRRIGVID